MPPDNPQQSSLANIESAILSLASAIQPQAGQSVQEVGTTYDAVATGTTTTPNDDTIPQNTEGNEYFSQTITPRQIGNILIITVDTMVATSAVARVLTMALHQDSVANALAAKGHTVVANTDAPNSFSATFRLVVTSLSQTTYKIRIGQHAAGTLTVNGFTGGRMYGAIPKSVISIREERPL